MIAEAPHCATSKNNSPGESNVKDDTQYVLKTWYKDAHQRPQLSNLCLPHEQKNLSKEKYQIQRPYSTKLHRATVFLQWKMQIEMCSLLFWNRNNKTYFLFHLWPIKNTASHILIYDKTERKKSTQPWAKILWSFAMWPRWEQNNVVTIDIYVSIKNGSVHSV